MISVCAVPELRPWRLSASATGLVSLIGQLLAHEKQAAEELGQWTEKRDVSGDAAAALMIKNLALVQTPAKLAIINRCQRSYQLRSSSAVGTLTGDHRVVRALVSEFDVGFILRHLP